MPETVVIRLNVGEEADVVFPGLNNRRVPGVITEVGARSRAATTFPVTVQLQEKFSSAQVGYVSGSCLSVYPGVGNRGASGNGACSSNCRDSHGGRENNLCFHL